MPRIKKPLTIEDGPIDKCFVCKQKISLLKMSVLTCDDIGINEMKFMTEHVRCRKFKERLNQMTSDIDNSICFVKDLKSQRLAFEWEFFNSIKC
jgi:hypothetical protein